MESRAKQKKASGCDASLVIYHYRRKVVFFVHALRDIPFLVCKNNHGKVHSFNDEVDVDYTAKSNV